MALALTNYAQNRIIDNLLRGQANAFPATFYIGLFTGAPTQAGGGTEVSGGSYARVAVASSLVDWAGTQGAGTTVASSGTSGATSNNTVLTYPAPTANWGTIVAEGFFDAPTGGNMWIQGPLTTSKTVNSGDAAPSYAVGALTYTLD